MEKTAKYVQTTLIKKDLQLEFIAPWLNMAKLERAMDIPSGTLLRHDKGEKTCMTERNLALMKQSLKTLSEAITQFISR